METKRFISLTRLAASAAILATLLAGPVRADEVRVLSAAALQTVFQRIVGDFERTSGHKLSLDYGTIGGIAQRVRAGATADLVIGSTLSMPALVKDGKIEPGSEMTICRVAIGAVVPAGTPKPHIQSLDDLKQALLAAKVVVYAEPVRGGAAGVHIAEVIRQLGIADRLAAKTRYGAGGDVTEVTLAQGPGALGMTQVSEIVGKRGAEFVGPVPPEAQNYTIFVAGTPRGVTPSEAVMALLAFLRSPAATAAIEARGMQVE